MWQVFRWLVNARGDRRFSLSFSRNYYITDGTGFPSDSSRLNTLWLAASQSLRRSPGVRLFAHGALPRCPAARSTQKGPFALAWLWQAEGVPDCPLPIHDRRYQTSCCSSSETSPVGPSFSNCANRIATSAPCSGVRVPRNPLKSVATCPGAAPFTLMLVAARLRA
jgi:hypothetical protein